jgi:Firmicute plasmid replication protein (RepL)
MKRTLFESQTVDMSTGEIIKTSKIVADNNNETFGMHRTTEGIEWVYKFKGNELQCLLTFSHLEDFKTGVVSLSPLRRKEVAKALEISVQSLSRVIKQLENKDALHRITDGDLILNPLYFYKGKSSKWGEKYRTYLKYKEDENSNI